jgi:hypothetical protein
MMTTTLQSRIRPMGIRIPNWIGKIGSNNCSWTKNMKDWDPEPAQKDCENEDIEVDR